MAELGYRMTATAPHALGDETGNMLNTMRTKLKAATHLIPNIYKLKNG